MVVDRAGWNRPGKYTWRTPTVALRVWNAQSTATSRANVRGPTSSRGTQNTGPRMAAYRARVPTAAAAADVFG